MCLGKSNRNELKRLQAWHGPFQTLRAHMSLKVQECPVYDTFFKEISGIMNEHQKFKDLALEFATSCQILDKAQDCFFVLYPPAPPHPPPTQLESLI